MVQRFDRRLRDPIRALLLAVCMALAVSGCTGEESEDPEGSNESPPPSQPIEDPPPPPENAPPVIENSPPLVAKVGEPYGFLPDASDPDGDELTFEIANRPEWASFDTTNGALSGTPRDGDVGESEEIEITVSDGKASTTVGPFRIIVHPRDMPPPPENSPPVISGTPATSVVAGTSYSFRPSASDPDDDSLTFSITNKPVWASFSTRTGRLSGTPSATRVGTYRNIRIRVSDGTATAELPPFSIEVLPPPNGAPTISGTPPTSVVAGSAYSFQPDASDPDGDTLTFSIENKPAWANFSTSSGRLSGTPTSAHVGIYEDIVIRVSDGTTTVGLPPFSIEVTAAEEENRPPVISGNPPQSVLAGASYEFEPAASDPDGDPLTFSIQNKPAWADFDTQTGALTGTPDGGDVGTYSSIVISVSDGEESVSLAAFSVTVTAVANGSATVRWQPPTENTDGSELTDLAGFRISYGTSPSSLTRNVTIDNPGITSYVIDNLTPGTWYFGVRAYRAGGQESELSELASKTID